jgi:type III pantothenate kinase
MLLALDIGNTNIVVGVFTADRLIHSWRLSTQRQRTADEMGMWALQLFQHGRLDPAGVDGVVIASVVPTLTRPTVEMAERYFDNRPLVVDALTDTGMPVLSDAPSEVGADRIVNGVAAYERYGRAAVRPLIVVDFGTATTFDYVSRKGEYMGGCITPGIAISSDALFDKASKLPRVELKRPNTIIAKDTVSSMQAGIMFGYAGLVDGIVDRMKAEARSNPKVVATGGLAKIIAPETKSIDVVDEFLTLDGLRIIYERNK